MNLYSVTIDALRRFAARHRAPRVVEKRTYVFILVPFNFSKNGNAKKAVVAHGFIDNHACGDRPKSDLVAPLPTVDRIEILGAGQSSDARDVDDEPELDFRMMWTWFLPNPLWKPKQRP